MEQQSLLIVQLLAIVVAAVGYLAYHKLKSQKAVAVDLERKPSFDREADLIEKPTPLTSLTPEKVVDYDDRPWRPFRWPYHQTMSIFKLDINHWLDMDKWYCRYLDEKQKVFRENPKDYCDWLPESKLACDELLETIVEHMTVRYPNCFKLEGNTLRNLISKEDIDLSDESEHPLHKVAKLAKEDFYVVQKRADGQHYLVAAQVPFPGGYFSVADKIDKPLNVIHKDVPYYKEKLQVSMERWFNRMKPHEPVERASWYISWDHALFCSKIYTKSEDDRVTDVPFEEFVVRVERQTLRRLPKSQAIIFTNHPVFYSIEEMKDEPMIPSILKKAIQEGPEIIVKYKNFKVIEDYIVPYLDKLIQRQIDMGIISKDDPVKTQPSYPFAHWVKDSYGEQGWTNPMFREAAATAGCPFVK